MLFDESMTNEIDANSQYAQYMKQKKAEDKNKKIIKEQQQKQAQSFKIIPKKQKAKKSFNSYKNKPLPKNKKIKNRVFNAPKHYNSNNDVVSNGNHQNAAKQKQSMAMNNNRQHNRGRAIQSLFKDNNLLKLNFAIPKNVTREELQSLKAKVNDLYDADVVALETFYDD